MKVICFLLLSLALRHAAYAQNNMDYQEHSYYLDVYDNTGHNVNANGHSNLSGSPFLNNEWGNGAVVFKNGRQISGMPLKFDIQDNKLYFKKDSATYSFADKVLAFRMTYKENDSLHEVFFRSGYPDRKGDSTSFLYEVINDGPNVHFLKRLNSAISQQYVYGSAAKENYVITEESYLYIVKNNLLIKVSDNKKSVLKALPGYQDEVEKFSADNNINFTTDKQINQLISSLNRVK